MTAENQVNISTNQGKLDLIIRLPDPKSKRKPEHPYGDFVGINTNKVASLNHPHTHFYQMLSNPEFSGEAAKVLWGLIIFLDFDNFILLPLSKVGRALNLERSSVSRGAKKLEKIGILQRGERVGNFYQFRLNPHYAWKGELAMLKMLVSQQ